jgi:hypothetical protein
VAQRYGARILDPVTGMRRSDGSAPAATVYVGERLLMRTTPGRALDDTVQALNEVTKDFGVRAERIPTPPAKGERALHPEALAVLQRHWVDGVRLLPVDDQVRMPVDAWPVLAAVASRDAAAQPAGPRSPHDDAPSIGGTVLAQDPTGSHYWRGPLTGSVPVRLPANTAGPVRADAPLSAWCSPTRL